MNTLLHGPPGHPLHPPLTDVTIGAYTFAGVAAVLAKAGVAEYTFGRAWWVALIVGLGSSALTVVTGLLEWFTLTWGSALWKKVLIHALTMVTATVFVVLAIIFGHKGYKSGEVENFPFILTIVAFVALTVGGWLGGALTYTHGMRVLKLVEAPPPKIDAG